jgi:hypothetical protein
MSIKVEATVIERESAAELTCSAYCPHFHRDVQEGKANTDWTDLASSASPLHSYGHRTVCLLDRYQSSGKFTLSVEQTRKLLYFPSK